MDDYINPIVGPQQNDGSVGGIEPRIGVPVLAVIYIALVWSVGAIVNIVGAVEVAFAGFAAVYSVSKTQTTTS